MEWGVQSKIVLVKIAMILAVTLMAACLDVSQAEPNVAESVPLTMPDRPVEDVPTRLIQDPAGGSTVPTSGGNDTGSQPPLMLRRPPLYTPESMCPGGYPPASPTPYPPDWGTWPMEPPWFEGPWMAPAQEAIDPTNPLQAPSSTLLSTPLSTGSVTDAPLLPLPGSVDPTNPLQTLSPTGPLTDPNLTSLQGSVNLTNPLQTPTQTGSLTDPTLMPLTDPSEMPPRGVEPLSVDPTNPSPTGLLSDPTLMPLTYPSEMPLAVQEAVSVDPTNPSPTGFLTDPTLAPLTDPSEMPMGLEPLGNPLLPTSGSRYATPNPRSPPPKSPPPSPRPASKPPPVPLRAPPPPTRRMPPPRATPPTPRPPQRPPPAGGARPPPRVPASPPPPPPAISPSPKAPPPVRGPPPRSWPPPLRVPSRPSPPPPPSIAAPPAVPPVRPPPPGRGVPPAGRSPPVVNASPPVLRVPPAGRSPPFVNAPPPPPPLRVPPPGSGVAPRSPSSPPPPRAPPQAPPTNRVPPTGRSPPSVSAPPPPVRPPPLTRTPPALRFPPPSQPPSPPPSVLGPCVASQPPRGNTGPVCGSPTGSISVIDQLDGTCYYTYSDANTYISQTPCTESIFTYPDTGAPVNCGSLMGSLYLSFYPNPVGPCVGNTQGPQMRSHLTRLGLNDVAYIMTLWASSAPPPPDVPHPRSDAPPPPIEPYLSSLESVGSVTLTESYISDPESAMRSFPNLRALTRADTVSISYSSLTNLTILSGLRCARGFSGYGGNLTGLQGIEQLSLVNGSAPPNAWSVDPYVNFYTPNVTDISSLSGLARCLPGGVSLLEGSPATVSLTIAACRDLTTWNDVCRYIQGYGCPPQPPPPSPPPTSPPPPPPSPPSPPSPPPTNCMMYRPPAPQSPICGSNTTSVTVTDYLDGRCTVQFGMGPPQPCTGPIFTDAGRNPIPRCGSYAGALTIRLGDAASPGDYLNATAASTLPQIASFLQLIGLGNVRTVGGMMTLVVAPVTLGPMDGRSIPLRPDFFSSLQYVGDTLLLTREYPPFDAGPALFNLAGVPGLKNIAAVGRALVVSNTALGNLADLSGLSCIGGYMTISNNRENGGVTGLQGMSRLSGLNYISNDGYYPLTITNNMINDVSGLKPLQVPAQCNAAGGSNTYGLIQVELPGAQPCFPNSAYSFDGLCKYMVSNNTC